MKPRFLKRRLFFLVYGVVVTLLLIEVGMRLMTEEARGLPEFRGTLLVPVSLLPAPRLEALRQDPATLDYVIPDPELGWTIKKSGESGLYRSNSQGLRDDRELVTPKPDGVHRTLVVGDSLAHGDEIPFVDTWCRKVQAELPEGKEIWCGAVPGYGTDQAILRLRRLLPIVKPDRVVLGLYRMNLLRNLTFVRAVQSPRTGIPFSKPRFALEKAGGLSLHNSPVLTPKATEEAFKDYGSHELSKLDMVYFPELHAGGWFEYSRIATYLRSLRVMGEFMHHQNVLLRNDGPAHQLGFALVDMVAEDLKAQNIELVLVILPDQADLMGLEDNPDTCMEFFARSLQSRGFQVVNPSQALLDDLKPSEGREALFVGGRGHPNARCTTILAREIAAYLK